MSNAEFQVLERRPQRAGAPTVWTVQRHFDLVQFVNELVSGGCTLKDAIGQARDMFALKLFDTGLKDATVKGEFYRARRFFESVPRIATLMLAVQSIGNDGLESNFAKFIDSGVIAYTGYGMQQLARDHIGRAAPGVVKTRPGPRRD